MATGSLVSTGDVDNSTVVGLVSGGVASIMTRLYSELRTILAVWSRGIKFLVE